MINQVAVGMVQHTLRAAVRIGEDFYTVEQVVTLPIGATDEQIQAAADTGMRMYVEQQAAVSWQIGQVREAAAANGSTSGGPVTVREPDAPASDNQRRFMGRLQDDLSWSSAQMAQWAESQNVDLVSLTKGQASTLIDTMIRIRDGVEPRPEFSRPAAPPAPRPPARRNQPLPIEDDGSPHPAAAEHIPF
jgi:hypothetical protein